MNSVKTNLDEKTTCKSYYCTTCDVLKNENRFGSFKLYGITHRRKQCKDCRANTLSKYYKRSDFKQKQKNYNNAKQQQMKNSLKIIKIINYAFTQCNEKKKDMIIKAITPFINTTATHTPSFIEGEEIVKAHKVWEMDLKKFASVLKIKI